MAAAAFDYALIAPFTTAFVNGERIIGVNASLSGAAAATWHLARWFNLDGGIYNLKFRATKAAVIRVGVNKAGLSIALNAPADTTVQTQIYLPRGQHRIDVEMTQTTGNLGFAMLLFHPDQVIYASERTGWVYESATVPDDVELTAPVDPRRSLDVFSVLPNWETGIVEQISYLTDIAESETAAESRRAVRPSPRRTFEAQFLRHGSRRSRLDAFAAGVGRKKFLMPMWHEQFRPAGGIEVGDTFVQFPAGTLANREFMVGDLVFVNNGSPEDYVLLEVGGIDTTLDRLTWKVPPARAWRVGTRIMPLRVARVMDQVQISNQVDRVGGLTMRFELSDPDYRFGPSWGYCVPLWRFKIDWSEAVQVTHERSTYVMDNEVGPVNVVDPGNRALVSERVAMLLRGRQNVALLRRFFDAAAGRNERFYFPSFTRDIEPTGNLSGLTFDAAPFGFTDYFTGPQSARTWIGVVLKDGSPTLYRKITQVEAVPSLTPPIVVQAERFTLNAELPPIPLSLIERVQFIVPSRFDQDTFELQHLVDESAAVRTTIVTRSVDGDGMPDIECWVTSLPYPFDAVDAMNHSLIVTEGRLQSTPQPLDAMDMGLLIESGILGAPLQTYNDGDPEALDTGLTVEGGEIRDPLLSYDDGDPEALDMGAEITTGTLAVVLVTYDNAEPEAMDMALTIESGTLV